MLKLASIFTNANFVPRLKGIIGVVVVAGCLVTTSATIARTQKSEEVVGNENIVSILEKGSLAQIAQLIDNGLNVNLDIKGDGTPLIIAVRNGNFALVKYLLARGADVNVKTEQDANALIVAALNNNLSLVTWLHEQGAEIDAITEFDETALISASRAGHFQIVRYLVQNGADVNLAVEANVLPGKEWRSPLNCAKTKEIRQYLKANGARARSSV